MIFAIAIYAGLDRGPLFELFTTLNLALGTVAVLVGGTVFFRSAWRAARARVLHLDLPIALGIALAFAGSVESYFAHRSLAAYFETLDVFIALMVTLVAIFAATRAVVNNEAGLVLATIVVVVAVLGTTALHLAVDRSSRDGTGSSKVARSSSRPSPSSRCSWEGSPSSCPRCSSLPVIPRCWRTPAPTAPSSSRAATSTPRSEIVALIAYLQRLGQHPEHAPAPNVATLAP